MKAVNKEIKLSISRCIEKFKKGVIYSFLALSTSTTTVYGATLSNNCAVNIISPTQIELIGPTLGITTITPAAIGSNASTGITLGNGTFQCISLTAPTDLTTPPCAPPTTTVTAPGDGSPLYLSQYDLTNDIYCAYEAVLTPTAVSAMAFVPPTIPATNPTSVPIFTPVGIIATISGLLWFGRRRTLKVKTLY